MKLSKLLLSAVVASTLAACAKSPQSIQPAYVSEVGYQSWSCRQLGQEMQRLRSAYARAAGQQENARTNDTVGVLLLGLPVSSLSGDNIAPQIAHLKGQSDAIRRAAISKGCIQQPRR